MILIQNLYDTNATPKQYRYDTKYDTNHDPFAYESETPGDEELTGQH